MGGRFLEQRYTGSMMAAPFEGAYSRSKCNGRSR
jgi:hypothetical protein